MQLVMNILGLLSALLLSFVSSGMETGLYRVSRVRMRIRAEQGERRAAMVLWVLDRLDAMVTTILINNNIAAYTGTYFLALQLASWRVPHAALITTAVITPLFFILTESLPKQLAYNSADRFTLELIRVFVVLRWVFSPAVWLLNRASALLRRLVGSQTETTLSQSQRTLLMEHLSAGVAEKVLTEEQNHMAMRIMQLESFSAGDSMIPLRSLLLLPQTATRARAVAEMSKRRVQLALLVDPAGRPTSSVVTTAGLLMRPGEAGEGIGGASEQLERIRAGVAIPEVLNLFRKRHARQALVVQGSRVVGLINTQTVLDRIAGIA